jgi:hypothetical protein
MKSGQLTTRPYIWIVTISLAPNVRNFSAGLPRLVQADQAPVSILE